MDLRTEILLRHSKENTQRLTSWVGDAPDRFAQLMDLFLHDEYRVVQRAAWIVSHVLTAYPELGTPHLATLLGSLDQPKHPAVLRNVLKVFADALTVPEAYEGELADRAFRILADPQLPVAVHVHAMQILFNLTRQYPELGGELRLLLEDQLEHASPAYCSRARKILRQLPENAGHEEF